MPLRSGIHGPALLGALLCVALPGIAQADYTATQSGSIAIFAGDSASDGLTIERSTGLLAHNRFLEGDAGFASATDFDSAQAGVQPIPVASGSVVIVDAGGGDDVLNVGFDQLTELADLEVTVGSAQIAITNAVVVGYNASVDRLNVDTGPGDDAIDVAATAATTPVDLNTGTGADILTVGDGTLDTIESRVRTGFAEAIDTLIADDSQDPDAHQYLLQSNGFESVGISRDGEIKLASHSSFTAPQARLLAGQGGDTIALGADFGNATVASLFGGGGNDRLVVEALDLDSPLIAKARRLDGGPGIDTLDYSSAPAGVPIAVDLAAKTAPNVSQAASRWENVSGGAGPDRLRGNGTRNVLRGGGGADRLKGRGGNDRLTDGKGRNRIDCGTGRRDVAVAKRRSKVKRNCERVRRP